MNDIDTKELGVIEILRKSFQSYRKNLRFIVPLCLIAYAPVGIIEQFIPMEYNAEAFLLDSMGTVGSGLFNDALGFYLAVQIVGLIFSCLVTGGFTYLVLAHNSGRNITLSELFDVIISKWPRLVFTSLLFYLIVSVSAVIIIPAIYFSVLFAFSLCIVIATKESGFRAMIASAHLVRGHFFKRMLYALVFTSSSFITAMFLETITASFLSVNTTNVILNSAINIAISVIVQTICSVFTLSQAIWFANLIALKSR